MKKRKIPHQKRNGDTSPPRRFSIGRIAYMAFLCPTVSLMFSQPAFAATDVWTKATEIMQDVYTQILANSASNPAGPQHSESHYERSWPFPLH